jgi:hypothetical protein
MEGEEALKTLDEATGIIDKKKFTELFSTLYGIEIAPGFAKKAPEEFLFEL